MKTKFVISAVCIDRRGKVISSAVNSYKKTHPIQKYFAEKAGLPVKEYLHAEILAIIRAKETRIDTIRVMRTNKDGSMGNAKPCPVCQEAIKAYGIRNVEYSTDTGIVREKTPTVK